MLVSQSRSSGALLQSNFTGAAVPEGSIVRIAVVIDTQTNGAAMNPADCFKAIGGVGEQAYSFRNLQYSGRFVVLFDKSYTLTHRAGAGDGTTNDFQGEDKQFKINIKIPEKYSVVDTTGTTDNVNVITDNSIHLIAWKNGSDVRLEYVSRLRFVG